VKPQPTQEKTDGKVVAKTNQTWKVREWNRSRKRGETACFTTELSSIRSILELKDPGKHLISKGAKEIQKRRDNQG